MLEVSGSGVLSLARSLIQPLAVVLTRIERSQAGFIPNSRFDRLETCTNSVELIDLCDQYLEKTNEFVFQTKLGNFPTILHYYLGSSKLHFSDGTCPIKFSQVR